MNRTAAIIVAGGSGVRFGGPVRKQYVRLLGWPILRWSVHAFDQSASMTDLVVVVPEEDRASVALTVRRWGLRKPVTVVSGGITRADSVRQGLSALAPGVRWVAVHDAVRPLITSMSIEKILQVAQKTRAAIAACLSHDTVKLADARVRIQSTPDRSRVWLAQTPQIFERRLLERAHGRGKHVVATDDAQLVERLGVRVSLVDSPAENIKVTRPIDLVVAKHVLWQRSKGSRRKMS